MKRNLNKDWGFGGNRMNQIKKTIRSTGIIHFWELPRKIHVILKPDFKQSLMKEILKLTKNGNGACKMLDMPRTTFRRYLNKQNSKIRIDNLFKFLTFVNNDEFNFEKAEKQINWIGDKVSHGIMNPKLPFNFNSREGARFLAAICNDGWISDGVYYSNSDAELRNSVKNDALYVLGGDEGCIKNWIKEKDQYLSFPSVIRDLLILMTDFKGVKSENNPSVPPFVLKNEQTIYGWLEQTIADEGCIKYYPKTYRREIHWKRTFKRNLSCFKLNADERKMLDRIGIGYSVYYIDYYKTINGTEKVMLLMRIARKENLIKLRRFIEIPHKRKDRIFTEISKDFTMQEKEKYLPNVF